LLGAPGPTAITVASGNGLLVAEDGKKMPVAVFYKYALAYTPNYKTALTVSGLKRWTKTRSSKGTRDLIDLNVA